MPGHGLPCLLQVVNYDYCFSAAPSSLRNPSTCESIVGEFQQCGGKSNCTEYGCADVAWPGELASSSSTSCTRCRWCAPGG